MNSKRGAAAHNSLAEVMMTTEPGAYSPTRAQLFERALQLQTVAQGVATVVNGDMGLALRRVTETPIPEQTYELEQFVLLAETILLAVRDHIAAEEEEKKRVIREEVELKRLRGRAHELSSRFIKVRYNDYATGEMKYWADPFRSSWDIQSLDAFRRWVATAEQLLPTLEQMIVEAKNAEATIIGTAAYANERLVSRHLFHDRKFGKRLAAETSKIAVRKYYHRINTTWHYHQAIAWCHSIGLEHPKRFERFAYPKRDNRKRWRIEVARLRSIL